MVRGGPIRPRRRRSFRLWLPLRVVRGHPRLFAGIAVSLVAGILLPDSFRPATRLLIAWNAGTWFYFIAAGIMIARASPQSIRRRARTSDEGKFFILVLTSLAAIAAIASIIAHLAIVKDLSGTIKGLHIGSRRRRSSAPGSSSI
jgi:uncharacterized membrane protein